ncbi:MAG: response regulator transcription factor [Bdellovibrionaceae bacterium]|nr:response regulator transcription factor [Pseudobdellovibrionaceae bacterium]
MAKLFFLEDDPILGEAIRLQLQLEGHIVEWAKSLRGAKELYPQGGWELFLLDVNLPDGTGMDFCSWVRGQKEEAPAIFLTARTDEDSVVQGFNVGANDYIRKPFGRNELAARIRNQLSERRAPVDMLRFNDVILLKNQQALKFGESTIPLNRREFEILSVFFERPDAVVTREALLSRLDAGDEIFDRTIDSHISHIRSKLKKNGIETMKIASVYGSGYRLEKIS